MVYAVQDETADPEVVDLGEDVIFYGDLQETATGEQETKQRRSRRSLGLITAAAELGTAASAAVGPSLTGAAAITSSIKPLVWGGLGTCE